MRLILTAVAWARCAVGLDIGAGAALLIGALIIASAQEPAHAQQAPAAEPADQPGPATGGPAAVQLPPIEVEAPPVPISTRGPSVSPTGANAYGVTSTDIGNMPAGENTTITDVLAQMPGVAIDQNQQIHIRNTEGPQFQYQINGALVPLDINTNPPFISNFSSLFVSRLDLLDGVLPSRYSYATGGVVDIQSKAGNCDNPGGSFSLFAGQRSTIQPSVQYAGCEGQLSYYVSGLYDQSNTAFSSATPGANAIHDWTNQGQTFNYFSYPLDDKTKLSVVVSAAGSNNQLPNVPNLAPQFTLAGVPNFSSGAINSYLNFRDYLGMVILNGAPTADLSYQIAYAAHSISEQFKPDNAGELIFEGVASTASHNDLDNTLEGDLTYKLGSHTLGTGFYFGEYRVIADDTSLVFPVDENGNQTSTTPITLVNNAHATNFLAGIYVDDLWWINDQLRLNVGLRYDILTGFTNSHQFDPTINLSYLPTPETTLHGGFARYMQVPSFQGISPTASAAFAGTSAAGPPGISTPITEDDFELDVGIVHRLTPTITLSQDNFFEVTDHYLDTGQFGVVPIFAPFNYDHGSIWGSETAINYRGDKFSAYGNVTVGRNLQRGVVTGQFNFDPDELAFINSHHIVLDHQPLLGASAGATYKWEPLTFSLDMIYSGGLRAGFADIEKLPTVVQINAAAQIAFRVPGVGELTDRLTVLNVLDRINLIRPSEGIGIFQSAYGPRLTVLNTFTVPF